MVTNHLANLPDDKLAHEVRNMLYHIHRRPAGAIAAGCHVGAHRAPTGAMICLVCGGCTVDDAVAHRYLRGASWLPRPRLNQAR